MIFLRGFLIVFLIRSFFLRPAHISTVLQNFFRPAQNRKGRNLGCEVVREFSRFVHNVFRKFCFDKSENLLKLMSPRQKSPKLKEVTKSWLYHCLPPSVALSVHPGRSSSKTTAGLAVARQCVLFLHSGHWRYVNVANHYYIIWEKF